MDGRRGRSPVSSVVLYDVCFRFLRYVVVSTSKDACRVVSCCQYSSYDRDRPRHRAMALSPHWQASDVPSAVAAVNVLHACVHMHLSAGHIVGCRPEFRFGASIYKRRFASAGCGIPPVSVSCAMSAMNVAQTQNLAEDAFAVNWISAACLTCLLYDHVLTFGQEIHSIWPSRLSLPKIVFLVNRYIIEAILIFTAIASSRNDLSSHFCHFFLRWLSCTWMATNIVVDGILVMRVCALYHDDPFVRLLVLFLYIGDASVHVGLTVKDYVGEQVLMDDFNDLPGCYAAHVPAMLAGYWVTAVIVESLLFLLILAKTISWWRSHSVPPVLFLLARDSAIYFTAIFACLMSNLLIMEYGPPSLSAMMLSPTNAVGCIAGSRMLLNLRAIAAVDYRQSTMGPSSPVSLMLKRYPAYGGYLRHITMSTLPATEARGTTEIAFAP